MYFDSIAEVSDLPNLKALQKAVAKAQLAFVVYPIETTNRDSKWMMGRSCNDGGR